MHASLYVRGLPSVKYTGYTEHCRVERVGIFGILYDLSEHWIVH